MVVRRAARALMLYIGKRLKEEHVLGNAPGNTSIQFKTLKIIPRQQVSSARGVVVVVWRLPLEWC